MKKLFLSLLSAATILACDSNKDDKKVTAETEESKESHIELTTMVKKTFTEGKIDVQIYFPGNRFSEILNKVDPAQGDIQQQIEKYAKELSQEDAEDIQNLMKGNIALAMQVMFAPMLKNEIFVRGDQATAKCDGLVYHLENTLNGGNETGTVFIQSQSVKNSQITFDYDKDFFGESQLQTTIDLSMYDRKATYETDEIAGYKCNKVIYTLKNDSPMAIGQLEVWTSEHMPKTLNFIHPFYLEEAHGIMKISIYQDAQSDMPMVYEFKKVTPGSVSDSDMNISQSQPIYNGKSDTEAIAAKLMGIMFGM
ncbi:hypothetical protein ACFSKL_04525 [Belliella marina]|uniref:DUF4412 domain-containing protein n=1 Tax=Belliella marina TaxID=1644146 RepID=A0ABW4VI78_9BACT